MNLNQIFSDYVHGKFDHVRSGQPDHALLLSFYGELKRTAAQVLSGKKGAAVQFTEEDLANEFLLDIRRTGNTLLNGLGGVKRQMARLLAKSNRASAELFDIARNALKALKTRGEAFERRGSRVNEDLWWGSQEAGRSKACYEENLIYEDALSGMEPLPPPAHEGRRLVSPARARAFVRDLLARMGCPVQMSLIQAAFCRKTSVLSVSTNADKDGAGALEEQKNDVGDEAHEVAFSYTEKMLVDQFHTRGEKIGARLCHENLCATYIRYYYPKNIEGRKVTLKQFGDYRRLSEKGLKITKILRTLLPDHVSLEQGRPPSDIVSHEEYEANKLRMTSEERFAFGYMRQRLRSESLEFALGYCERHCGSAFEGKSGKRGQQALP
jgi:hypothetical protein